METAQDATTQDWKSEVNRRLAAHRNRQGGTTAAQSEQPTTRQSGNTRAAQAAARVAARYANAPTYQDLFAGNAEAVVRAAGAAVEAARGAQAAAEAVLAGLQAHLPMEIEAQPEWAQQEWAQQESRQQESRQQESRWQEQRWLDEPTAAATHATPAQPEPRWHDTMAPMTIPDAWEEMRVAPQPEYDYFRARQGDALEDATVEPVHASTANLIEFPRELVASHKARPRLAEQPQAAPEIAGPQLSIFEVYPAATELPTETVTDAPQWTKPDWTKIADTSPWPADEARSHGEPTARTVAAEVRVAEALVDDQFALRRLPQIEAEEPVVEGHVDEPATGETWAAQPAAVAQQEQPEMARVQTAEVAELYVAGRSHRLLAGIVDASLVALAFLSAATVVLTAADSVPTGRVALMATVIGLALFAVVYQAIFFAFSDEGTPGMRYARIALCTFDDNNPTVRQSLMRIPATMVAVLPLGAGLLWSLLDRDGLGWQDRLSQTYQRKY